jgi:hypothetical protein
LSAFSKKPQKPRRISAIWPVRLPGAGAVAPLHASAVLVAVPVRASGNVPLVGVGAAAVALL